MDHLIPLGLTLLMMTPASITNAASAELGVRGSSPSLCRIPNPTAISPDRAPITNETISNESFIDQNATVRAWKITLTSAQAMCNGGVSISLQSLNGGMKPVGAVAAPVGGKFMTQVNYVVTVKWGNAAELTLDTAMSGTTAVERVVSGANLADLVVSINTARSETPLVAGEYRDGLVVKIGPSL
jgi:hypothetical protein